MRDTALENRMFRGLETDPEEAYYMWNVVDASLVRLLFPAILFQHLTNLPQSHHQPLKSQNSMLSVGRYIEAQTYY